MGQVSLKLFGSLWTHVHPPPVPIVVWKEQGQGLQLGDIVLFQKKPCYRHELSAAMITVLLKRKNSDVYGATIKYRIEVRGRIIAVNRHLRHLYPFMNVEKAEP